MSGAFDRTWLLVKDFYFSPLDRAFGMFIPDDYDEDGEVMIDQWTGEPTFFRDRDYMMWHKREGLDDEANYPLPPFAPTPNEPFRRGGSMLRPGNRPDGTVGLNLTDIAHHRGDSEQSIIDEILSTLMHEDAHAATWKEIEEEMEGVKIPGVNNPMNRAQEMAAFQLEYPGGADADRAARERYAGYLPEWQTPYGMPRGVIR